MVKSKFIIIAVIALLISAVAFYYSNIIAVNAISTYDTRKEDILLTQKKLIQEISLLNQTIEQEIQNQKILNDKIIELSKKADLPPPVINTTKIVTGDPIVVAVPKPAPKPVTRAS